MSFPIRQYIVEMNNWELKTTRIPTRRDIADWVSNDANDLSTHYSDQIQELLELWYEIFYKYGRIRTSSFQGIPVRGENILKFFEERGEDINKALASLLAIVLDAWVNLHDYKDPRKWAERRYDEYLSYNSQDGMDTFNFIVDQTTDYQFAGYKRDKVFMDMIKTQIEDLDEVKKITSLLYKDLKRIAKEDEEEESLPPNLDDYVENHFDFDVFEAYLSYHPNDIEKVGVEILQHISLPVWKDKLRYSSIDQTVKMNRDIINHLENLESKDVMDQFVRVNQAINSIHTSGSMKEHFSLAFGVDEGIFDKLAKDPPKEWDEELKEMGFVLY